MEESQIKFIKVNFLQFTPVFGQLLIVGQVDVHGEQVVVLAVVDVTLLMCRAPCQVYRAVGQARALVGWEGATPAKASSGCQGWSAFVDLGALNLSLNSQSLVIKMVRVMTVWNSSPTSPSWSPGCDLTLKDRSS